MSEVECGSGCRELWERDQDREGTYCGLVLVQHLVVLAHCHAKDYRCHVLRANKSTYTELLVLS